MSGRHRAPTSRLCASLAVLALTLSVIVMVARTLPLSNNIGLILAASSPYAAVVAVFGLALSMLCRWMVASLVAAVITAIALAIQGTWYFLPQPGLVGDHVDIRVLSSNLRKGQADASAFVGLARASADVITVSELTPEAVRRYVAAGISAAFPYRVLEPKPGAAGIGLWSRFPLVASPVTERNITMAAARLKVPGVGIDPVVGSVHIISPVAADGRPSFGAWRSGITSLRAQLGRFADAAGPGTVVVAGDFNSTPDMRQFRDLLTNGYRDVVDQTGAGLAPTFPSDAWIPPLITIDHVLTRQARAASTRTIDVPGSDHRALLATVEIPIDPAMS